MTDRGSDSRPPTSASIDTRPLPDEARPCAGEGSPGADGSPFAANRNEVQGRNHRRIGAWIKSFILTVALLIPVFLALIMVGVYWQARTDEARSTDAILVLGAAQYNGTPTEVFQARLDHAFTLYAQGYAPRIVLTGGRSPGDAYTEAESGLMYLQERGVPAADLILANAGNDTWGSLESVDEELSGTDIHTLLLVSDGFHLLRSELIADHFGFKAYGSAASGSPIREGSANEFSYAIRETGGIVSIIPKLLF